MSRPLLVLPLIVGSVTFAHGQKSTTKSNTLLAVVGRPEADFTKAIGKPLNTITMFGSVTTQPRDVYHENKYRLSSGLVFVATFMNGNFQDLLVSKAFKKSEWKTVCGRVGIRVTANTQLGSTGLISPTPELPSGYHAYWGYSDKLGGCILSIEKR